MKGAVALLAGAAALFSGDRKTGREGSAAYTHHDYHGAAQKFDDAARRNPSDPLWRLGAGTSKAAEGKGDPTEDLEAAAKSADPKVAATAQYQLGTLALGAKNYAEAAERLRRSLMLDPRRADAKRNLEIALANLKTPKPPPKSSPKPNDQGKKSKPEQNKNDGEFQRKAGMSKSEAEALLRALDAEQRKAERVATDHSGRDW